MRTLKYNSKNFSLQDVIQAQAQRDSEIEWARRWYVAELPKYEKPKVEKNFTAGVYNMVRQLLP